MLEITFMWKFVILEFPDSKKIYVFFITPEFTFLQAFLLIYKWRTSTKIVNFRTPKLTVRNSLEKRRDFCNIFLVFSVNIK